jgi:hypothetical protein
MHWRKHFFLVTGYGTIFLLVFVFLRWFQTEEIHPVWHPTRLLGYYATFALLYITGDLMVSRWKKAATMHKHSHFSDWLFLILLFLTALTGIMLHALRITGFPMSTYAMFTIHMAVAVPMLVVEVPFGKWAHIAYRPLALYFNAVKARAANTATNVEVAQSEAA